MGVMPSPSGEGVRGPARGRMREKPAVGYPLKGQATQNFALISRLRAAASPEGEAFRTGGSFSLRAKSRLRRLRSDTRLRAQPLGGSL